MDSFQTFHIGSVEIGEWRVINRVIGIDDLLRSTDVLTIVDCSLEDRSSRLLDSGVVVIVKLGGDPSKVQKDRIERGCRSMRVRASL